MKNKYKILISTVIFSLILGVGIPVSANSDPAISTEPTFVETIKTKVRNGANLLLKLESSMKDQQDFLKSTDEEMVRARKGLREAHKKMQTLKDQLQNVQELISQSNKKILSVRKQIAERETEVELLYNRLKKIQADRDKMNALRASILQSHDEQETLTSLPLFLSDMDLGDVLQKKYFLELAENASSQSLEKLNKEYDGLAGKGSDLLKKREKLLALRERMENEKRNLLFFQESKQRLLTLTKGDEEKYQQLLEQSRVEQEDVVKVIQRLRDNYSYVAEKLNLLKNDSAISDAFSVEEYERALQEAPQGLTNELRWPVPPIRGISAYFHDEAYKKSMGIAHNAVDIRIPQESVVRAAASGVVYKTVSAGTGYSYIIIAHQEGLLTLYGHMYDIFVHEGDTVFSGQQIGLSGGIPGTRGAGWLTTGAHLHFEVFKDWKHVDPLEYLPLEYLPVEYVPEKYQDRLHGQVDEQRKIPRIPSLKN